MKKLILTILVAFSLNANCQSSYNVGVKMPKGGFDHWSSDNGNEYFITYQTTAGYFETYNELLKIFDFYNINIENPTLYEVLCDENFENYEQVSNDLFIKNATISIVWKIDEYYNLVWTCDDKTNGIGIVKRKKR